MTTIRQAHRNSYVSISNKLAQNNNLSWEALGLMTYLLSLPDNWKIHLNHLCKIRKAGRVVITRILNELKDAGYIKLRKLGFKKGWEYFLFESPASEEEFEVFKQEKASTDTFERISMFPNNSITEQFDNQPLLNTKEDIENNNLKNKCPKPEPTGSCPSKEVQVSPLTFSKDVEECTELLCKSLRTLKSDYKITDKDKVNWSKEIDKMVRLDKRDVIKIKSILSWLPTNAFWAKNILSGGKLRNQFDRLEVQKLEDDSLKIKAEQLKKASKYMTFASKIKALKKSNTMLINAYGVRDMSCNLELTYLMPYEDFCRKMAFTYSILDYEGDM
jgi:hypothetical protein